jgi:alpha-beta hydrolase superfamily lysophospholipase
MVENPMRRRLIRIFLIVLLLPPILAAIAGWVGAPGFLHPIRRELTPDLIREADASLAQTHSARQDFDVRAPDRVLLHGWKVIPPNPNGSWVILFHGVADNRVGVIGQSEFLLRAGYGVVMMDARAHGASEGSMATYGWLERNDTRAIIDALLFSEWLNLRDSDVSCLYLRSSTLASKIPCVNSTPEGTASPTANPNTAPHSESLTSSTSLTSPASPVHHIFALGESMGAGLALQSAAADPRIEAVVAEAPFASLREASYDYAGLRKSPFLGKTLLRPFSWTLLYRGQKVSGLDISLVSPEKSVASRAFPVLLICDEKDEALPCRHTQAIYNAAIGPKQLWVVPGAYHTAALGFQPAEFVRRVTQFFAENTLPPVQSTQK